VPDAAKNAPGLRRPGRGNSPSVELSPAEWERVRERRLRPYVGKRAAVALILMLPVVVAAVSFWPGHMSADTLAQIHQVRTGEFTNLHAPLLMWIWRRAYLIVDAGPGWALTLQLLTFVVGAYLILRAAFRPVAAAATTALICFLPPVFGMLGYMGRDMWFVALLVLTFGLIARAGQVRWRLRGGWIVAATVAAWLALASRQNAVPALATACILIAGLVIAWWIRRRDATPRLLSGRWGLALVSTAAGLALTFGIVGTQYFATAAIGASDANAEQYTLIYDVAALSQRERSNLFPPEVMKERGMRPVDAFWNVDHMLGYQFGSDPPIAHPLSGEAMTVLRERWTEAIRDHPFDYLDVRWDLFVRQLAITRPAVWVYHPVIDPNPYGYSIKFGWANAAAKDYVEAFADDELEGNWIYTVWVYVLLNIAGAVVLLRWTRGWALASVGALALAALTYQAGLFFTTMQVQSRYEFPVIVAGLLCAAVLARLAWVRLRGRGAAATTGMSPDETETILPATAVRSA
jgi:hypothetical protein